MSDASALLLAADAGTRLYFQPDAGFSGPVSDAISFRAWDQTTGTAGTKVNASVNGGTTAFSTATETASIVINAAAATATLVFEIRQPDHNGINDLMQFANIQFNFGDGVVVPSSVTTSGTMVTGGAYRFTASDSEERSIIFTFENVNFADTLDIDFTYSTFGGGADAEARERLRRD